MTEFDEAFFARSEARVRALQETLSRSALEGLARDVVQRLSSRVAMPRSADVAHPEPADIDALCTALVSGDPETAREMMLRLPRKGVSLDLL